MRITQDELKKLMHYDPDTGVFTWVWPPTTRRRRGVRTGSYDKVRGLEVSINGLPYGANRLAWLYVYGYGSENDIVYIDGGNRNVSIANLKESSRQCTVRKVGNIKSNTSGIKDVSWGINSNKWKAVICVNGANKYLGTFSDIDNAALARLEAERKYGYGDCGATSPAFKYLSEKGII